MKKKSGISKDFDRFKAALDRELTADEKKLIASAVKQFEVVITTMVMGGYYGQR